MYLVIFTNTVGTHITTIVASLGFTSRSSDHDPSKDGLFVINYYCLISATSINITQNCYFLLGFLVTK